MKKLMTLVFCLSVMTAAWGQILLTGQVTNEDGEPLAGASVVLTDLRKGTASDDNGLYRIKEVTPGTHSLRISYIGYKTIEQKAIVKEGIEKVILHVQMEERILEFEELTVIATRAGSKTPMTYTNMKKEELESSNLGQDVPYLLRWTPSVIVTSDAGTGIGYTGIRVRGSDPTRINVTLNGIPLNDSESQSVYWVDLPDFASSVNDLQIQRGVGTSTNGGGAFGATINLNTAQWHKEPYAEVNATYGSFNTQKGNIRFGTGLLSDKFTIDGRFSNITSDGYIDRGSSDLQSYFFSAAYMGKSSSLRLNAFSGKEVTYQAWNGVPADLIDDWDKRTFNSAGTDKEGEPYENEVDDYKQTHYQLLYDNQLSPNWSLNLSLHYTKGNGFYEQYKAGEDFEDYGLSSLIIGGETVDGTDLVRRRWLDNDFYGLIYSARYQSNDNKLDATIGGGANSYKGRHFGEVIWARFAADSENDHLYYDNDGTKKDFNIFGKMNYELNYALNLFVDLQYRRIDYDFLGINNDLENIQQDDQLGFFNPKAGLLYELNNNSRLYASFGVGSREPNRNDYTENPTYSRPKAEKLYNTELGFNQKWKKAALDINLYHMYYKDQLVLNGQINDVGEYMRINVDKSYRAGLEISGGLELTPKLDLSANATFSQNKVVEFTEYADDYNANFSWLGQQTISHENTDLAFSPAVLTGGALSYQAVGEKNNSGKHNLSLTLLSKYVSKQYIDNTSDENNILDPYFFTDLKVNYKVKTKWVKEVGFNLLVRNLFNAQYETNAWSYRYIYDSATYVDQGYYPQAGVNFLAGVQLSF